MRFTTMQKVRDLCVCLLLSQISLVSFLTENYPKIFGEGIPVHHESPSVCSDGENTYNALNTQTDKIAMEESEHEEDPSPSGSTCPTGNDVQPRSPTAPCHNEELEVSIDVLLSQLKS